MMSNQDLKNLFIYNLPYIEREHFCMILNESNKWEDLAGLMGYSPYDIQALRKELNPTDELLTKWSHHNHKISELFGLLSKMQHYKAMLILKPFVDAKYHKLIGKGEGNLNFVFGNLKVKESKDLKIGEQNFNKTQSEKILNKLVKPDTLGQGSNSNSLFITSAINVFKSTLPQIPFYDLQLATDNWNASNVLGKGGFGTVYKGIWKNTEVAIKKIDKRCNDQVQNLGLQLEQSFREIKILNSIPHQNILSLYAFSTDGFPCLVYQCMKNGSLEDRLRMKNGSPPLDWLKRFEIAKGTACGLQYLHTIHKIPLIHGDIKSANILLDHNFEPRIGDFGLAKEGSHGDSFKVTKIQGTRPYLPSEYVSEHKLSTKIDTYSYGIVLFELSTGVLAYDKLKTDKKYMKDWIDEFQDGRLLNLIDTRAGKENNKIFLYLIEIGSWCASKSVNERPDMVSVFKQLNNCENELFQKNSL